MKKIYTVFAAFLVATVCFGQSQRLVLFEEFTQASCPPCAATNPGLNTLLDANPTKVVSIKYQTSWPGYDPMNLQNPGEVQTRVTYYNVSGVPNGVEDGNQYNAQPSSYTQALIDARYSMPSPFTFALSHTFSPTLDSIYVHADITCSQAVSGASVYARFAVIERNIYFCTEPGTNGETHFEGVMKKMLPNATGTLMPSTINVGDQFSYDFAWKLTNVYDKNTLAVVGFIQNDVGKETYQAAYSVPQPLPNDARLACNPISGVPVVQCSTTINPSVTLENYGQNNLTSADISFNIDGGTSTLVPWTGNLAYGASSTIALGAINSLIVGNHTLNVSVLNPNAVTDYNTYYDNSSAAFTITTNIGISLPLTEGFVITTFPPANWNLVNPDNGPTWARVTNAGFNSTNSAKIDFYNSSSGQIDELWTPNYDFSQAATEQLDFDVAYRQYASGYNDQIQVQVSTDCGSTWSTIYNKSGASLATVTGYQTTAFTPTATQWRHETVSMNQFIGNNNVFVKIKATSMYGNNGYVDNININSPTGVKQNTLSQHINVYPVPSNGIVNLDVKFELAQNLKVAVYNLIGEVVSQFEIAKTIGGLFPIDLSKVANGSYTVKISTDAETVVKAVNIMK